MTTHEVRVDAPVNAKLLLIKATEDRFTFDDLENARVYVAAALRDVAAQDAWPLVLALPVGLDVYWLTETVTEETT